MLPVLGFPDANFQLSSYLRSELLGLGLHSPLSDPHSAFGEATQPKALLTAVTFTSLPGMTGARLPVTAQVRQRLQGCCSGGAGTVIVPVLQCPSRLKGAAWSKVIPSLEADWSMHSGHLRGQLLWRSPGISRAA